MYIPLGAWALIIFGIKTKLWFINLFAKFSHNYCTSDNKWCFPSIYKLVHRDEWEPVALNPTILTTPTCIYTVQQSLDSDGLSEENLPLFCLIILFRNFGLMRMGYLIISSEEIYLWLVVYLVLRLNSIIW